MGFQLTRHRLVTPHQITHGREIGAWNTGLNWSGYDETKLTLMSGYQNFTTDNQIVEYKRFDNRVDLSGNNITIRHCLWEGGALNQFGAVVFGTGATIEGCTIRRAAGSSWYICININSTATGTTVKRCDISGGKTQIASYANPIHVLETYCHDTDLTSDPTNHPDNIEIYGGTGSPGQIVWYDRCQLPMGPIQYDGSINISPFGSYTCTAVDITDCVIDGGQGHILIDDQGTASGGSGAGVTNVRVLRNDFGGHTNPDTAMSFGIYMPFTNEDGRSIVTTQSAQNSSPQSVLWPSSGVDANYWQNCTGLSPDRSGQACDGTQP